MTADKSHNLSEFQIPCLYVIQVPDYLTRQLLGSNKGMCAQGLCELNDTRCVVGMIMGFATQNPGLAERTKVYVHIQNLAFKP